MSQTVGKVLYGALFTLAWPACLALWSAALDRSGLASWPIPLPPWAGWALALGGLALVATSMRALVRDGGGLPMNAYPTTRLVTGSAYALLPHPIYVGFSVAVAGAAAAAGSPAGFWLAAPLSALASAALVLGYEGPALAKRLGEPVRPPLLALPPDDDAKAGHSRRALAVLAPLAAWAVLYAAFSTVPTPTGAVTLAGAFERGLPLPGWAPWVYTGAYAYAVLSPLALARNSDLRRFAVSAWLCVGLGYGVMILLPGTHGFPDHGYGGLADVLMEANRAVDADWLACPSFHVAWATLASLCLGLRLPRLRPLLGAATLAVAASCLLTGAHAVVDVAMGWALARLCWDHRKVWSSLVLATERLGNSLGSRRVGPVRILSHARWSMAAASAGTFLATLLLPPSDVAATLALVILGLVGGGAWGYLLEGGGRLSRPFGYFGFLAAASGGLLALYAFDPARGAVLMAAFAAAAPLAQGLGRARCAVQGCCHGRPVHRAAGMRIRHPESRVTQLSAFACVPIHPTPLYSAVANAAILAVLLRLWAVGAPGTTVAGAYLILSSLARFVEERFRGEPQTPVLAGLATYQWLSIGTFLCGLILSALPSAPLSAAGAPSLAGTLCALAAGLAAALSMSVDLPDSDLPLSRLTVSPKGRAEPSVTEAATEAATDFAAREPAP